MDIAGVYWDMQNRIWPYSNMYEMDGACFDGKGKKSPRHLSEAGSNFGSAAKDNDIVLGLIGDLPHEIKLQGHVCLG